MITPAEHVGEVRIKSRPEDFLVAECRVPDLGTTGGSHQYVTVTKKGYTTFEVVDLLAAHLRIPTSHIGVAGLKDEDGITEQQMSVPATSDVDWDAFNTAYVTADRRVQVRSSGFGARQIDVGDLCGNIFRLFVRGLGERLTERLQSRQPLDVLHFVNYYDTQRFGVAGGPRTTHRIGEALVAGEWTRALSLLACAGVPESELARQCHGDAEAFFERFDKRKVAFYQCAWGSFCWNETVREALSAYSDVAEVAEEGIAYTYPTSLRVTLELLARLPVHACRKYRARHGEIVDATADRCTVIQAHVAIDDVCASGGGTATLSFFLPSGCYATQAVRQYLTVLAGAYVSVGTGGVTDGGRLTA